MKDKFDILLMYFIMGVIILFILSIVILILAGLIEQATLKTLGQKQVPCYDKYSNVINGVECTQNITCGSISYLFKSCEIKK